MLATRTIDPRRRRGVAGDLGGIDFQSTTGFGDNIKQVKMDQTVFSQHANAFSRVEAPSRATGPLPYAGNAFASQRSHQDVFQQQPEPSHKSSYESVAWRGGHLNNRHQSDTLKSVYRNMKNSRSVVQQPGQASFQN